MSPTRRRFHLAVVVAVAYLVSVVLLVATGNL